MLLADGNDYTVVGQMQLILDKNNLEFHISFNIFDNQIHELNEYFFVSLSSNETDIVLNPQNTRVCIADNDGMYT